MVLGRDITHCDPKPASSLRISIRYTQVMHTNFTSASMQLFGVKNSYCQLTPNLVLRPPAGRCIHKSAEAIQTPAQPHQSPAVGYRNPESRETAHMASHEFYMLQSSRRGSEQGHGRRLHITKHRRVAPHRPSMPATATTNRAIMHAARTIINAGAAQGTIDMSTGLPGGTHSWICDKTNRKQTAGTSCGEEKIP